MRQMEDTIFYDLRPSAIIAGKRFHRVQCEYQVPGKPNEYAVKGVPEGGEKEEPFVLIFTQKGKVKAFRSKSQRPQTIKLRR